VLPENIDWDGMWKGRKQYPLFLSEMSARENQWDKMVPFYKQLSEHDEYPLRLLSRTQIWHEWSVLNIGCGIGTIAIAAAIRGKRVMVIDISSQMLDLVKSEAKNRHLGNIKYLHQSWESIKIGTDLRPHDVVITSRAIMKTDNLYTTLKKIDQAALRYAYVTAWSGKTGDFTRELGDILHRTDPDNSEDVYVYNMLHQMGISPNVEQIECQNNIIYTTPEQAVNYYLMFLNIVPEDKGKIDEYIRKHLIRRKDGKFELPDTRTTWSLIWWKKTGAER
jgi:SAM-dependent methyltransferase